MSQHQTSDETLARLSSLQSRRAGRGLDKRYPRIYAALKRNHGAFKAASILLDATRQDSYSLRWIKIVRRWK